MSKPVKTKVVRHREILRDNILGVTDGAVMRLAKRAGVKRLTNPVYHEVREHIKLFLQDVLKSTIVRVTVTKSNTISVKHVEPSLDVAMYSEALKDFKCHSRKRAGVNPDATRAHHFKPGTVALSDVRYFQKNSSFN